MGSEYQKFVYDLKKNSYLTATNRITDGQIKYDKKVKAKIVSIISTPRFPLIHTGKAL